MHRFISPYYIVNFLLIFVYPLTRFVYIQYSEFYYQRDVMGYSRENGIIILLGSMMLVKLRKTATWDHWLAEVFKLGKIAIILLYFFISIKVCLYFTLACSITFLFFRQPKYDGPSNMVNITSEEEFEKLVLNADPKKKGKGINETTTWLVEFYADWADTCIYTKPLWCDISVKYSTKLMKYAEVNVAVLKELAKKYNINLSGVSRQLPTLILFEEGEEKLRFPPIDERTGKVPRVLKYDKKELIKFFDIDQKFLATRGL